MNFLDTTLGSGVALESGMRRGTAQPRGGALMRFAEIETFWLRIEPRQTQSSLFQIVQLSAVITAIVPRKSRWKPRYA